MVLFLRASVIEGFGVWGASEAEVSEVQRRLAWPLRSGQHVHDRHAQIEKCTNLQPCSAKVPLVSRWSDLSL